MNSPQNTAPHHNNKRSCCAQNLNCTHAHSVHCCPKRRLNYVDPMLESFFILFVTNIMKTYVFAIAVRDSVCDFVCVCVCGIVCLIFVYIYIASNQQALPLSFGQHREWSASRGTIVSCHLINQIYLVLHDYYFYYDTRSSSRCKCGFGAGEPRAYARNTS